MRERLLDYPTVTRDIGRNLGRVTTAVESGRVFADLGSARSIRTATDA